MIPKPTKFERLRIEAERKNKLRIYRKSQQKLAVYRDGGYCVICWFKHHRRRRYNHVHHIYGRGVRAGDWREDYKNLMCTCMDCHPQPIKFVGANEDLAWVEDIMVEMNSTPINFRFDANIQL